MLIPDTADVLGGSGSILEQLQGIAVGGLSRYVDGELSKKFPLTSGQDQRTLDAQGRSRPLTAPAKPASAGAAFVGFLQNPNVVIVGVAVAAALALFFVVRK